VKKVAIDLTAIIRNRNEDDVAYLLLLPLLMIMGEKEKMIAITINEENI
jgi:hypothetical protein